MPPPAVDEDPADPSAAQPDVAKDAGAALGLDDASARLESALARLEALVEAGPLQSDLFRAGMPDDTEVDTAIAVETEVLRAERDTARARERDLEAAAAEASDALGRAMARVRQVLEAGGVHEQDIEEEGAGGAPDPAPATPEDDRS